MPSPDKTLDGQVAIVTGAGRGIGKAIACAFARAGAAVCCAARTQAEIEQTAREIVAAGGRAIAVRTDVAQRANAENMVERAVAAFGGLDILVLNAGTDGDDRPVAESDPDIWGSTIEVNLLGAYYCARAAIAPLKQRGAGKIIAVGSGLGHRGKANGSAYACSKAGLWMLTRVLAQELWPFNISVNELVPGPVVTTLSADTAGAGTGVFGIDSEWAKSPEDVVPLAMFLATQPAKGPTAQSYSLMRRDG